MRWPQCRTATGKTWGGAHLAGHLEHVDHTPGNAECSSSRPQCGIQSEHSFDHTYNHTTARFSAVNCLPKHALDDMCTAACPTCGIQSEHGFDQLLASCTDVTPIFRTHAVVTWQDAGTAQLRQMMAYLCLQLTHRQTMHQESLWCTGVTSIVASSMVTPTRCTAATRTHTTGAHQSTQAYST